MPSRIVFNHWKANLSLICCFFLAFFLGLNFWQFILPDTSCSHSLQSIPIDYQSFYNHFYYRTLSCCTNERTNLFLIIAVLSSYERLLTYLPAMFETWILTTTIEIEIVLFLEENSFDREDFLDRLFTNLNQRNLSSCLFMVKLKHVPNEYPPQRKSFYAMKFLHMFYRHRTAWILRLDDNAYVNIPQLIPWLKSIDHRQALYIGQGGTGRPKGPAIHFPPGKYFCMGGSGVILSSETLKQLGPWLDQCYQSEVLTPHEDVELGRCILTHLNLSCTNAYDSKLFFYHHYGPRYLFGYDFTPLILSRALIVHPISHHITFQQIFHFYQRKQHHRLSQVIQWKPSNPINYVTFINGMEFDLVRDIHYQFIDVRWKAYIDSIVQSYLEHLQKFWHQRSSNWTIVNRKYVFGYHRLIPQSGLELFVEILFNARSIAIVPTQSVIIRKRIHLRHGFRARPHFDYREIDSIEEISRLNLIVISSNKDEALERFLQNFDHEILDYPERQQFTLTILYFLHQNNSLIDHLNQLMVRYSSIIRVIMMNETIGEYNRGLGRQLALKYFTDDQLLFFLDVDVLFTGQSLINTRRLILHQLSSSSCAVYFPIIYSAFSNMFIGENPSNIDLENNAGLFSIYGFGNVVMRKGDLERVGGWDVNNHDWGDEDGDLFSRFVNISTECTIFRSVEPGFRHYYHRKMCDEIVNPSRQKMCLNAEANLLGSPVEMIKYLFQNQILKMAKNDNDFRSPVMY